MTIVLAFLLDFHTRVEGEQAQQLVGVVGPHDDEVVVGAAAYGVHQSRVTDVGAPLFGLSDDAAGLTDIVVCLQSHIIGLSFDVA